MADKRAPVQTEIKPFGVRKWSSTGVVGLDHEDSIDAVELVTKKHVKKMTRGSPNPPGTYC